MFAFLCIGHISTQNLIDDSQGPHDRAYHDGPLQGPVWYLGGYTISGRCGSNENVSAVGAPAGMASAANRGREVSRGVLCSVDLRLLGR